MLKRLFNHRSLAAAISRQHRQPGCGLVGANGDRLLGTAVHRYIVGRACTSCKYGGFLHVALPFLLPLALARIVVRADLSEVKTAVASALSRGRAYGGWWAKT
jgi:hypothetical protein